MMKVLHMVFLVITSLELVFRGAVAQSYRTPAAPHLPPRGAPSRDYLKDMPTVEEVRQKITGTDPINTAARQYGAFAQLMRVVRGLCEGGEFENKCSPDEKGLMGQYSVAMLDADKTGGTLVAAQSGSSSGAEVRSRWWRTKEEYNTELFRGKVLDMFSPRVRDLYRSQYKLLDDRIADARAAGPSRHPYPTADEAMKIIQPADTGHEIELLARRAALLNHLVQIVRTQWGVNAPGLAMTPEKQQLVERYESAEAECDRQGEALISRIGAPPTGANSYVATWFRLRTAFDGDAGAVEIASRFPGVHADRIESVGRRPAVNYKAAIAHNALLAAEAAAAKPTVWTPPGPDPWVAVAHRAGVSTHIFGLSLGEVLHLPVCRTDDTRDLFRMFGFHEPVAQSCWLSPGSTGWSLVTSQLVIELTSHDRPGWAYSVTATVSNEIVRAVSVATTQLNPAEELAWLTKRYGKYRRTDGQSPYEWSRSGLHVTYMTRIATPTGSGMPPPAAGVIPAIAGAATGAVAAGSYASMPNLFIESEIAYKARIAAQRALP